MYYPRIHTEIRKCFKCTCCFVNNFCFEGLITCNYRKPSLDTHMQCLTATSIIRAWYHSVYIVVAAGIYIYYRTQHTHTHIHLNPLICILILYYNIYYIRTRMYIMTYPLQCTRTARGVHKAPPKKLNFNNPLAFRAFKQTITRTVHRISYYRIIIILRIRVYIIITTYYNIMYLYVSLRSPAYIYIFYCYLASISHTIVCECVIYKIWRFIK